MKKFERFISHINILYNIYNAYFKESNNLLTKT